MKKTIGFVGLGKMGGNLALQAVEKGYKVVGHSRHFKDHLKQERLLQIDNLVHPLVTIFLRIGRREKKSESIITALFFFLMQELTSLILSRQYRCLAHRHMVLYFVPCGWDQF